MLWTFLFSLYIVARYNQSDFLHIYNYVLWLQDTKKFQSSIVIIQRSHSQFGFTVWVCGLFERIFGTFSYFMVIVQLRWKVFKFSDEIFCVLLSVEHISSLKILICTSRGTVQSTASQAFHCILRTAYNNVLCDKEKHTASYYLNQAGKNKEQGFRTEITQQLNKHRSSTAFSHRLLSC